MYYYGASSGFWILLVVIVVLLYIWLMVHMVKKQDEFNRGVLDTLRAIREALEKKK